MEKLPISALVVTLNEAHIIKECLESIQFCDEIMIADLGSEDNIKEVVYGLVTKIIVVKKEPIVELVHASLFEVLKNDWILIIDPDERITEGLFNEVKNFFPFESTIGSCAVACKYYFKRKELKGTNWGGIKYRILLAHKDRFAFTTSVHRGRSNKDNFITKTIRYDENKKNYIIHYWCNSYRELIEKHKRYLAFEGESQYMSGLKYKGLLWHVKQSLYSFYKSYSIDKGFRDGFTGLFLSIFWMWYKWKSILALREYQNSKQ